MYEDFEDTNLTSLGELKSLLEGSNHATGGTEAEGGFSGQSDISVPSPALTTHRQDSPSSRASQASSTTTVHDSVSMPFGLSSQSSLSSLGPVEAGSRVFLELCVNTGKLCQTLVELDLTHNMSDRMMFHRIKNAYNNIRGPLAKRNFLLKPKQVNFAQFGLEKDSHKAHIFAEPAYPDKEAINSGEWHYNLHPPLKPMPSTAFIHYLLHEAAPDDDRFQRRLPKKLRMSIFQSRASVPDYPIVFGWGIHIIEGPDWPKVIWIFITVLIACFTPLIAYVTINRDWATATSTGGLIVSSLTLVWMMMSISQGMGE